jgi:hypothetical protein
MTDRPVIATGVDENGLVRMDCMNAVGPALLAVQISIDRLPPGFSPPSETSRLTSVTLVNSDVVRKGAASQFVLSKLNSPLVATFMFDDKTVPANDGVAAPARAKTVRAAMATDRNRSVMCESLPVFVG